MPRIDREPINFHAFTDPKEPVGLETVAFRIGGFWIVKAQLPAVLRNAPLRLGTTSPLDFGLPPEQRHLEPRIINREAYMWVGREAVRSGLEIICYTRSHGRVACPEIADQQGLDLGVALGQFVVAPEGYTPPEPLPVGLPPAAPGS